MLPIRNAPRRFTSPEGKSQLSLNSWKLVSSSKKQTTLSLDASLDRQSESDLAARHQVSPGNQNARLTEISFEMWSDAYHLVKDKNAELVNVYETILVQQKPEACARNITSDSKNELQNAGQNERISKMRSIVWDILNNHESYSRLVNTIDAIFGILPVSKDFVASMISKCPPAAIAWSGICSILSLAAGRLKENKDMANGLKHSVEQIQWYMMLPKFLPDHKNSDVGLEDVRHTFQEEITQLYRDILEYQMQSLRDCYRTQPITKAVKTVFGHGEWKTRLEDINKLEINIDQRTTHAENSEPLHRNSEIWEDLHNEQEQARIDRVEDVPGEFLSTHYEERIRPAQQVTGTPQKLCDSIEIQTWLERPSSLLLVSVEPWYGDVVLPRYLVKRVPLLQRPNAKIYYFLFGCGGNTRPRTSETPNALHAMTAQTSAENPVLAHRKVGEFPTPEMAALWEMISEASEYSKNGDAVCLLHGLHECELGSLRTLMRNLKLYMTKRHDESTLKFLVTTKLNWGILDICKNFGPRYAHFLWRDAAVKTELREYFVAVVDDRLNALNVQGNHDRIRKALDLDGYDQSSSLWADVVFDVLGELSGGSFEAKQWKRLIDNSRPGSLTVFKKLLEPATTNRQWTPKLFLESQHYPSYPTVKKLLSIHLRSLLVVQTKPRRWKFEWTKSPKPLSQDSACSDDGPSLAVVGRTLYAVWRGHSPNPYLWWSSIESMEATWPKPKQVPEAMTTARPSIAAKGNTLIVMWKGLHHEERLWYSIFDCDTDEWKGPAPTEFGSKVGPALTLWETESGDTKNKIWAAWRGTEGDELFWRSSFNDERWLVQYPDYIDIRTDARPALASSPGRLYLAWTSSAPETSQQIRVSFLDADADLWEPPFSIELHCHSSAAPSLAKFKDKVYVAWRGKGNDLGIWLAPCVRPGDPGFERPQRLGDCATDCTPALVEWEGKLVLVWKGGWGNDYLLWWGCGEFRWSSH